MSADTRDPYTRCPDCGFITKPGSMNYTLTPDRAEIDWGRPVEVTCLCCHACYTISASDVLPLDAVMTCPRCRAEVPHPVQAARPQCPGCGLFLLGPALSQAQREELRITEGLASLALRETWKAAKDRATRRRGEAGQ